MRKVISINGEMASRAVTAVINGKRETARNSKQRCRGSGNVERQPSERRGRRRRRKGVAQQHSLSSLSIMLVNLIKRKPTINVKYWAVTCACARHEAAAGYAANERKLGNRIGNFCWGGTGKLCHSKASCGNAK